MENLFTPGQKLTVISISEAMGHTQKREIQVTKVTDVTPRLHYQNGPIDGYRFGTMKPKGKRKEFYLDVPLDALVFDGWDVPIWIDSEIPGYSGFSGNACLNITYAMNPPIVTPAVLATLREYIETKNLNPNLTDRSKASIVVPGATVHDEGTLLYPELETSHAVIESMKENLVTA